MKKSLLALISVLFCGAIFTSFSPSLDGRAVVANEGEMPQGIFAKTLGYLPGDVISVTNLSKKVSIDILVIGSIDRESGVAIQLSPEAAASLGIDKNSNSVVKITKRSGQLDEVVQGTAVIGDAFEGYEPETADEETFEEPEVNEEEAEVISENAKDSVEDTMEAFDDTAVAEDAAEEAADETVEIAAVDEEGEVIKATTEAPEEKTEVIAEETEVEEPVISEKVVADDFGDDYMDPLPEESELVKAPEVEDAVSDKPFEETEEIAEVSENEKTDENVEEAAEEIIAVAEDVEEVSSDVYVEDEAVATTMDSEVIAAGVVTDSYVEDASEAAEEADKESYEPIVLVPSKPNPPAKKTVIIDDEPEVEVVAEVAPTTAVKPVSKNTDKKTVSNYDRYKVNSLKDLKSGKYYIQIAVYSEKENIDVIFKKYRGQYPIVLVPLASGKGTQVLIGPLGVDEYGTVLQRFKSYGYKDAFLRKIK